MNRLTLLISFLLAFSQSSFAASGPKPPTQQLIAAQKILFFYTSLNHFDALEAVLKLGADKAEQEAVHDLLKKVSDSSLPRLEMGKSHFLIEGLPETIKYATIKGGLRLTFKGKKFDLLTNKKTFKQTADGILTMLGANSSSPGGEAARTAAVTYFTAYGMAALSCPNDSCPLSQKWPHFFSLMFQPAWDRFIKKNISDAENFDLKSWPGTLCKKESPDKDSSKLTLAVVNEETKEVSTRKILEDKTTEVHLVYRGRYLSLGVTDASFEDETYLFDETGAFKSGKDLMQDQVIRPSAALKAVLEQAVRENTFEKLCRFTDSPFLQVEMAMMACKKGQKSWDKVQEEFTDKPMTDLSDAFRYFQKFRNLLQEVQPGFLSEDEYCADESETTKPACRVRIEELAGCMKELVKSVAKKSERLKVQIHSEGAKEVIVEPSGKIKIENLEFKLVPEKK